MQIICIQVIGMKQSSPAPRIGIDLGGTKIAGVLLAPDDAPFYVARDWQVAQR